MMTRNFSTAVLSIPWRRRVILHALAGGILGYAVFHPMVMLLFRSLDRCPTAMQSSGNQLLAIVESFQSHMFPVGLIWGVLCAGACAIYGYYRAALTNQRDILTDELRSSIAKRKMLLQRLAQVEALKEADQRATRFIVHDLKSHLGCILGFSGLLRKHNNERWDEEATEAIERIHRQGMHMLGAVTDILDLACIEQNRTFKCEKIQPSVIFNEVVDEFSLPDYQGRIKIKAAIRSSLFIDGNPRLIRRILINLITNSFKHNPAGTHVVLGAEESSSHPSEVLFSCHDNGKGIPTEELRTLFDEFTSSDHQGNSSGIGLAFCKSAVEAQGGRLWCEFSPENGTTFYFTIPVADTDRSKGIAENCINQKVKCSDSVNSQVAPMPKMKHKPKLNVKIVSKRLKAADRSGN